MKYIVTEKGPIDRHEPGTDVSKVYPAAVLARLVKEGYVIDAKKAQASRKGVEGDSKERHTGPAAR